VALDWNWVARTDDDRTLIFTIDCSGQHVEQIVGVQISEDADVVSVAILGRVYQPTNDIMPYSAVAQYVVDLPSPLANRQVVNPN
jgi:hypothetical protein